MLDSWRLVGAVRGREGVLAKAAAVRKNWRDDEKLGMYVAMLCNTVSEVCRTWGIAIGGWRHKAGGYEVSYRRISEAARVRHVASRGKDQVGSCREQ
jgi:hypothetical protein